MTSIKHYDFKHYIKNNKYLIAGCSAVLLELALGAGNVQAASNNNTQAANQVVTSKVTQTEQAPAVKTPSEPAETTEPAKPAASDNAQEKDDADPTVQPRPVAKEQTKPAAKPVKPLPVAEKEQGEEPKQSPTISQELGERVIDIKYASSYSAHGAAVYKHHYIRQKADKDGNWEAVDWTPSSSDVNLSEGIQLVPVHVDAKKATKTDTPIVHVEYFVRALIIPTQTGERYLSDSYSVVYQAGEGKTVTLPDLEIDAQTGDIPAPYSPYLKYPGPDNVVKKSDGHYYLTRNSFKVDADGSSFSPYASYKVYYKAPITVELDDLNGNPYNGFADKIGAPAYYPAGSHIDYGQHFTGPSLATLGDYYLNAYKQYVGNRINANPKIVGYFDSEGKLHTDTDSWSQLKLTSNKDHFALHFAVADPALTQEQTSKTRTIVLHNTPTGDQTTTQTVTFRSTVTKDQITGKTIGEPQWQVKTGNTWSNLTAGNHSWAEFTVTEFAGYTHTPSASVVAAQVVDPNTDNARVDITYTLVNNGNPGDNNNPGNNDDTPIDNNVDLPDKPNIDDSDNNNQNHRHNTGNHDNGSKNGQVNKGQKNTRAYIVGKSGQQATGKQTAGTVAHKSAAKLPQTGNQGFLATLGLAVASLFAALGLGYRKKN